MTLMKTLAAGLLAAAALNATAQAWPEKPVRMIVPFPAGSATDMAARVVGQQLQAALGQSFVVDNKPGAGGNIAGSEVVRAAPDGYTLLFSSNSAVASNVALLKSVPYDPLKDFTPVAGIAQNMLVLMVKPTFPAKTLPEFIAPERGITTTIAWQIGGRATYAFEGNILVSAGYEVVVATDGREALDLLANTTVDLVVTDVEMPRVDGFELLARIRERFGELPVIMSSTRSSPADRQRAVALGADAYFVKSESGGPSLIDAIQRFVEVPR